MLEVTLQRKRQHSAYHFYLVRFRLYDLTNPRFERRQSIFFSTMQNKIMRQLPCSGPLLCHTNVCGLNILILVKLEPKLRFEPVAFLLLACFSINLLMCAFLLIYNWIYLLHLSQAKVMGMMNKQMDVGKMQKTMQKFAETNQQMQLKV